jgi:hypothetical protein
MDLTSKSIGLVLSGGIKGLAHAGALKILEEKTFAQSDCRNKCRSIVGNVCLGKDPDENFRFFGPYIFSLEAFHFQKKRFIDSESFRNILCYI